MVPLRTSPLGAPFTNTLYPWRGNDFSAMVKPTSFRGIPAAFCASSAGFPTKSPFFIFTSHWRFASSGVTVSSMSLP